MAKYGGRLYIASMDEIFTSADRGETWHTIGPRPKGDAVGLIITHEEQARSAQARSTMYLALSDEGIYRSTDGGTQWNLFNDGLANKRISTIAAVEKTVFAGTGRGLYRLDSGTWKKLPVETSRAIYSLAVCENNLYVGTGPDLLGFTPIAVEQEVQNLESHTLKIFHSANLGASWTEITPSYKSDDRVIPSGMMVLAAGETLLASSAKHQYRSTDNGQTWTELLGDTDMLMTNRLPAVAVNETTFYKAGPFGIFRTTDGGKGWSLLIDGMVGTRLKDLVVFNNRLYAHTGFEVYQSTDAGVSWKSISTAEMFFVKEHTTTIVSSKPDRAHFHAFFDSKLVVDDNNLYFLSRKDNNLRISVLSTDGNIPSPVQSMPTFDDETLLRKLRIGSEEAKETHLSDGSEKEHQSIVSIDSPPFKKGTYLKARRVVVCNDVFYAELH